MEFTVKTVREYYGEAEADWLENQIAQVQEEYLDEPCQDNSRLAILSDQDSVIEYQDAQAHGCCGFCDVTIGPSPSDRQYLYGFNYGH